MKLLHVADLHGGLLTHSRTDPTTGLPSRLLDVGRCWHRACEIAAERAVDVVIVAGDLFHSPNPDAASLNLFAGGLRVLEENEIPTVLIPGNHDRAPHPGQQSVVEVFASDLVRVATTPQVVEVDGLRIACLPSVSRHQLMAARPGLSRTEADEALVDGLVTILGLLRSEQAHVLTGHWPVQGAVLGNERDIAITKEPTIPLAELEGPWAWVAMGHIHKEQGIRLDAPDPIGSALIGAYPGSIDRMNFGEANERKGVLEVEVHLEDGKWVDVPEFHELPARRFLTYTALGEWDDQDVEEAIVRVRLELPEGKELGSFDRSAVLDSLHRKGAHQVLLQLDVQRTLRARDENVTEALGPEEALERWFDVREVGEVERPPLRDMAKDVAEEAGP